jgi:solute carrier family 25 (mitochondrial carnitine/acylcarnitine transporter), member 20/29
MDVIKCNQQLSDKNLSISSMAKILYKNKGLRGFYPGLVPTILRSFPANTGLIFGVEALNH